jgi:integrase
MASIRKRQWKNRDGSVTVAWFVDFLDNSGERQREQFKSRGEANAFRVEIESQLRAGTFRPEAAKVTVKELGDKFLKHCEARMKRRERMTQRNYKTYKGHVRNYICPDPERHVGRKRSTRLRSFEDGIAAIRLSQLTPRVVADLGDRLREAGVSVPTTRKILGTLKVMLQYAIRRDLIAVNAAKSVTVIGRRDEGSKKVEPPPKEALKRLLAIADTDFRVKLLLACATGLRAGELHALRWNHLDLDGAEVTVETRVDAYGDEDVTKTAAGMRTIPLSGTVVEALSAGTCQ